MRTFIRELKKQFFYTIIHWFLIIFCKWNRKRLRHCTFSNRAGGVATRCAAPDAQTTPTSPALLRLLVRTRWRFGPVQFIPQKLVFGFFFVFKREILSSGEDFRPCPPGETRLFELNYTYRWVVFVFAMMLASQSGRCSWGLAVNVAFTRSLRLKKICLGLSSKKHVFIWSCEVRWDSPVFT